MPINTAMCNILLRAVEMTLEDETKPELTITGCLEAASETDSGSCSRSITLVLGHKAMDKV
jgi:hypothetical protein